ncbi:uncharacterized protein ARMOST_07591 [Armillaria ostoyae]|uniref:Uncharacterized protein n=1 Tax=Armillaria ostoyae TaxID=47428 RepID=A0A284R6A1_ARMOS|nr:uncharacterized protein ARMOST_07591 [Armillaria ostoyae]
MSPFPPLFLCPSRRSKTLQDESNVLARDWMMSKHPPTLSTAPKLKMKTKTSEYFAQPNSRR